MNVTRVTFALFVSLTMVACSSIDGLVAPTSQYKDVLNSREAAMSGLSQASACCKDYSTLPYASLNGGDEKWIAINGQSPVFNFNEGKSYFAGFKLPQNSGDLKITVSAQIDSTLFFPSVVLLDSQFKVTRIIDNKVFAYKEAQMLEGNRIEGVFTIDRTYVGNPNNESYLVIYTPENKLSETTTIMSEEKLMARSTAVVAPIQKDPQIPHSPWGLLRVTVEDLSGSSGKDNVYKPVYQDAIDANAPKVDKTPNKLVIAPASPVAQSGTTTAVAASTTVAAAPVATTAVASSAIMLPETESLYNQLILKAVSGGDIEKAMTLTNEAERAGSRSAKQTFVNAVKTGQK